MTAGVPTPAAQIRALTRPLIERNPDLVLTAGKVLCLLPVGHVARQIHIFNRPSRGYFTLEWRLTELYVLGEKLYPSFGRTLGLTGRSLKFSPYRFSGIWDWVDPTMADDFVDQVEAKILPLLRSLDTLEKLVAFMLAQKTTGYDLSHNNVWMALTKIALGDLDAARTCWAAVAPRFEEPAGEMLQHEDPSVRSYYQRYLDIGAALTRDDRAALAELLRDNERDEAARSKLIRHWRPSAFPLETGGRSSLERDAAEHATGTIRSDKFRMPQVASDRQSEGDDGGTMSSTRQIERLVRPLLDRYPDLVRVASDVLCYLPARHWGRYIRITSQPSRAHFTLQWCVSHLFEPGFEADFGIYWTRGSVGRSRRFKPEENRFFEWDDPTMPGDFVDQVEAEILPLFRSLDTFEKMVAFIATHPQHPLGPHFPWMTLMHVALGDIPAAQKSWRPIMDLYVPGRIIADTALQPYHDQWCRLTEPLMAGDRAALARLLHEWEASVVTGTKLEPHWQSTPFPLERAA